MRGAMRRGPALRKLDILESGRRETEGIGNSTMTRLSSRFLAAIAVVGAAIVASLVGGVGAGHASTSFTVVNTALIGTSGNGVPEVSYGGKIGFETTVTNTNSSNATHVQFAFQVPGGSFVDATDPSCAPAKGDSSTMICIPNGGTMNSGSSYTVDFRFTAPTSGSSVTTASGVSIAAKSQGNPLNNGTLVQAGNPVTVTLNAGGFQNDTYLRGNEGATAGGPQNFSAQLPNALFGTPFGLELGIKNQAGTPICATCLPVFTELTIPAASFVTNVGNPFYDGTSSHPYGWTMSATAATSFKLTGIFHIDDALSGASAPIPACAILPGGGPTLSFPVCYDTLTGKNHAGVQTLTASGRGLENGRVGFG